VVFHAGTARAPDGTVVTAGGRVVTVVATGDDVSRARARAYAAARTVRFGGHYLRTDIAADDGPLPFDAVEMGQAQETRS
jgi:phosphoribosylamine--glycine ligase